MYGTIRKSYGAKKITGTVENVVKHSYEEKKDKKKDKVKEDLQKTRYMKVDYVDLKKKEKKGRVIENRKKFKNEYPIASIILTMVFTMMVLVFGFGFGGFSIM
jgi:hypothetical protein